jgi:RNA polymerase sigma-70 factor (TIGR02960 family)
MIDAAAFEPHRRELHVHCYRMLGNFEEAEDAVQEAFFRAWRARERFDGANLRAWLYKIATTTCLDVLKRLKRRPPSQSTPAEIPWIQPYPDRLLDEVAPREDEPDAVVVARETIELAYLTVIQLLPPRQRAVLILRDVLGMSAAETAEALEMSVAATNSALQRARATLDERLPAPTPPSPDEHALLERFIEAHERADPALAVAMVAEDIRITMPPHPWVFDGFEAIRPLIEQGLTEAGVWRLVPTRANRMPAAANYLKAPGGREFRAFKVDVLRIEGDRIKEITTFDATLFDAFGLPAVLA